jgi:hypothetical protein
LVISIIPFEKEKPYERLKIGLYLEDTKIKQRLYILAEAYPNEVLPQLIPKM